MIQIALGDSGQRVRLVILKSKHRRPTASVQALILPGRIRAWGIMGDGPTNFGDTETYLHLAGNGRVILLVRMR